MKPASTLLACAALFAMSAAFSSLQAENAVNSHPTSPLGSRIFNWNELVEKPTDVGSRRDVADQPTRTLEKFECHISTLNAGHISHPPHRHPQEELIILKEGELEVNINGTPAHVGPGSLFFFASYDLHNVHNVGTTPATYYVLNFATPKTFTIPKTPAIESAPAGTLKSGVFEWSTLPVKATKSGERREILDAPTVTCNHLETHVTTLKAGQAAHAPHHHPDEEIVIVKDGTLDVTINGQTQRVGPGALCFFASNDEHGMTNAGTTEATYYVLRVVTPVSVAMK